MSEEPRNYRPYKPHDKTVPAEIRFWDRVQKTNSCWFWVGSTYPNGRGFLSTGSRQVYAYRFSWELHHGPIPKGLWVLHNCPGGDNPNCVNPDHLFLGTAKMNTQDCLAKGRFNHGTRGKDGEDHNLAKLTEGQVILLRKLWEDSNKGHGVKSRLSRQFGVCRAQVRNIIERKQWDHV